MTDICYRAADNNDYPQLVDLWKSVFNDTYYDIDNFYNSIGYDFTNSVCTAWSEDKLVSMLNVVPLSMRYDGGFFDGGYIYAGCTDPMHRGNGYYGNLLRMAERGRDFIALIPENDSLIGYYGKFGYNMIPNPIANSCGYIPDLSEFIPFDGDYGHLYRIYISHNPLFIRTESFFTCALKSVKQFAEIFYNKDRSGYIVCKTSENKIVKIFENYCGMQYTSDIIRYRAFAFKRVSENCPVPDSINVDLMLDIY